MLIMPKMSKTVDIGKKWFYTITVAYFLSVIVYFSECEFNEKTIIFFYILCNSCTLLLQLCGQQKLRCR